MSIRYKLLIAFSVVVILAAGVAVYGSRVVSQTSQTAVRLYDGPLMAVNYVRSAQLRFLQARETLEKMLLVGSVSPSDIDEFESAMKQFSSDIQIVRERMPKADTETPIELASTLAADWFKASMSRIKIPRGGLTEIPMTEVLTAKGVEVAKTLDLAVEEASAYGFNFRVGAEQAAEAANTNLIVLAVAAMIVGIMLSFGVSYTFTRPIRQVMQASEEIAAGNFETGIMTKRKDELGRLLTSLNTTRLSLQAMVEAKERDRAEQLKVLNAEVEKARQEAMETQSRAMAAQSKVMEEQTAVFRSLADGLGRLASGDLAYRLGDGFADAYRQIRDDFNSAIAQLENAGAQRESQRNAIESDRKRAEEARQKIEDDERETVVLELTAGMENLGRGNLAHRIEAPFAERYQELKDNFNTAMDALQGMIGSMSESIREVMSAANEISGSTTNLSQRTEEQAASLEETSASMEEIAATVKENAENSQQANQSAAGMRDAAARGAKVVADAVTAMGKIETSSRKVGDIIGVIDEIARQTNLLALNAAVEAARAGEAGRGFAVVASEVRTLAQRSSQAAKDIKDLITNSNSQVKEGVELVNRAGSSLQEIVESIKKVAEIVTGIASASNQQSAGIEEVNQALNRIDEVTQQNSALVEESAAAAKMLEEQAKTMEEQVSFFGVQKQQRSPAQSRLGRAA
jgi:methyl-accepting chemotaxis protein